MIRYQGVSKEKIKKAHELNYLEPTETLDGWLKIEGYDFSRPFNFKEFIESYFTTGFQATSVARAIQIIRKMRKEKATIFLGFTSNMATCGIRDIIAYLVKEKMVDVLVTTAGGVEEDIIKTIKPFVLGSYDARGHTLHQKGINRTGNIFIPNDRYIYFERLLNNFLKKIYKRQKDTGKIINAVDFVHELGKEVNDEKSICYQATKNNVPIICLPLTDGSLGDIIYFFKQNNKDFQIDMVDDLVTITNIALNAEKTGIIVIGGSVPKHQIANANLFRGGADYAVYITTATESEGSNAGANIEEAISWGKIKSTAEQVKVYSEASIVFPLIVAGAFMDYKNKH